MPYEVRWQTKDEIILLQYKGFVSVDDIIQANEQLFYYYLSPAQHPLHLITDLTALVEFEVHLWSLGTQEMVQRVANHPFLAKRVYFNKNNPLYRQIEAAELLDSTDGFFHTLREAVTFLNTTK